jgi:hypothetical protein
MDTHRSDDRFSQDFDGISRREALLVGSGGLAAAIFALRAMPVRAQESTPDTTGGMPEGVNVMPGVTVNVEDMPPAPVQVAVYRITIEPGATAPISTFPFPGLVVVEQGTLTCPGAAGRVVVKPDGTSTTTGDEEVIVNTGESIYVPANVADGARNDGADQIILTAVDFMPGGDMATPTA